MRSMLGLGDRSVAAALAATLLSFAFWPLVMVLALHEAPAHAPEDFKAYFRQINWWPYPFFFLAMAPVLWLTWEPMLRSWRRLTETDVLVGPDGRPDDATMQQVLRALRRTRGGAVLVALIVTAFVNAADWAPRYDVYFGAAPLDRQLTFACDNPNSSVKWIFAAQASAEKSVCVLAQEATLDGADRDGIRPPPGQLLFNAILVVQQCLIVLFAALAVVQVLLHTLLFAAFERLPVARAHGLRLQLNSRSPLNEFGLEHWNHALNNFYWAASPALLAVFLSRLSTPPEDYLPGQVMLGIAVPACLIVPMIATIIVRQARLPATWATIEPDGPVPAEDYRRQQLWPLDRNWSSKLGIVLAFALAALSLGFEISQFTPL